MKKVLIAVLSAFGIIFGLACAANASTLDSIDIYLKHESITKFINSEHDAPTSISDAGEERISSYTGGVSYYSEELNLPGKGGLDVIVGRRYNSAGDSDISGDSYYVGVERNTSQAYIDTEKYVFPYHLNEDFSDSTIFIVFNSIQDMLEAESNTASITVVPEYEDEGYCLSSSERCNWGIEYVGRIGLGFSYSTYIYLYENVCGSGVTLYRDTSMTYDLLHSESKKNDMPTFGVVDHGTVCLKGGWEYDVPAVLTVSRTADSRYEYECGLFYDSYTKESVHYEIQYSGSKILSAKCYSVVGGTRYTNYMYTMESEFADGNVFNSVITRVDGTKFYVEDEILTAITDRYGNTITLSFAGRTAGTTIIDTLGRVIVLNPSGITLDGEEVVSYSCTRLNNDIEDPNGLLTGDDDMIFTAKYKISSGKYKTIKYYHSQRSKIYKVGNVTVFPGTVSHSKTVLDKIVLPTGAERVYDYTGEYLYDYSAASNRVKDYRCTERYDVTAESSAIINDVIYEYTANTSARTTVITYPKRSNYTITEKIDSDGCITKRVTECTDVGYTTNETFTYTVVGSDYEIKQKKVSKTNAEGILSEATEYYTYDSETHKVTGISLDGNSVYKAEYSTYGLLKNEYSQRSYADCYGFRNVISGNNITQKKYVKLKSFDSTPTVMETVDYTYDEYGNIASVDGEEGYKEYIYEYGDYSEGEAQYSLTVTQTYPAVANITDSAGNPISSANVSTKTYYDKRGNMVKTTDGEGNSTSYTYDLLGRVLTVTNPDGTKRTYSYNDTLNRSFETDENGKRYFYGFDTTGRETARFYLNEEGNLWKYIFAKGYDSSSRLTRCTTYDNGYYSNSTKYTYYSDNSLKSEELKNKHDGDTLAYNEYAYLIPEANTELTCVTKKKTDSENVTLMYYTNPHGYKIKDTVEDGTDSSTQKYDTGYFGTIKKVTDPRGNVAHTYTYDYRGRVTCDKRPVGKSVSVYDGVFLSALEDSNGDTVREYEYNTMGLLIKETAPVMDGVNSVTEYYYDRNGNCTKTVQTTGGEARVTRNVYDSRNRLVASDDGSGSYTRYEYDNLRNVTKKAEGVPNLTDALDRNEHHVTDYKYSFRDYLIKVTDPMGFTESYEYNTKGTLVSSTDKNGNVTKYTYDGYPHLLKKTTTGSDGQTQSVSYEYDLLGNVTKAVDESGTEEYTYDMYGNMLTETKGDTYKEYTYDKNCNRLSMNIEKGSFSTGASYTYDANNRLTKIVNDDTYTSYTYDDNNRLTKVSRRDNPNNKYVNEEFYTYYTGGLLKTKQDRKQSGYVFNNYSLLYYADGNIASVNTNGDITSYTYDKAGRLSSETAGNVTTSYTYDVYGNRATMTRGENAAEYSYDKNNRLTAENVRLGAEMSCVYYYYNNDGSLKKKTCGTEQLTHGYDLFGRLISSSGGNVNVSYAYDANGTRISKTSGSGTTEFINDSGFVVGELSGENVVKYAYGLNLISINNNGTIGYYYTDEHGSVSAISDSSRSIVANYDYDAFGNETSAAGDYYNPLRYCGEYCDFETGLIYLRARYYDPAIGRFISEDPAKDGANWYVYCGNNPIAFVDPWGLAPGDRFNSPDEAADDFAKCYSQESIDKKREYGSVIYKVIAIDWEGKRELDLDKTLYENSQPKYIVYYTYSEPKIGSYSGVKFSFTKKGIAVAQIHTHGAYNDFVQKGHSANGFSEQDIENIEDLSKKNRDKNKPPQDTYVVTQWGDMFKATYKNNYEDGDKPYVQGKYATDPNIPVWYGGTAE